MSNAQENLDRAVESAHGTLRQLCLAAEVDGFLLADKPPLMLRTMAADLEAVTMALHEELHSRPENQPVDWG